MSNIIVFLIVTYVLVEYARGNYEKVFLTILVSYVCMPVVKFGNSGINSAYVSTAVCLFIFLHSMFNKRLVLGRIPLFFLMTMLIGMGIRCIGWIKNGVVTKSSIISFIGLSQYIMAVFMLAVLVKSYHLVKKDFFRRVCVVVIILNYCLGIPQILKLDLGKAIVEQLYIYPGRDIVYNMMLRDPGYFVRMFGTFYTPTLLGITSLMMLAFFSSEIVGKGKVQICDFVWCMASLGLGLFAFSKLVIIGVFIIWGFSCVFMLIQRKQVQKNLLLLVAIFAAFLLIGGIQSCLGLFNYARYYYIENFNVFVAMETRYANLFKAQQVVDDDQPVSSESIEDKDTEDKDTENKDTENKDTENEDTENEDTENEDTENKDTGNSKAAFDIFLQYPFVGVGPCTIRNEFIGDSEYIEILHDGGSFTFIVYAIFYGTLIIYLFIRKQNSALLVLLAIGLGGISVPVFSSGCVIPFLAFTICNEENPKKINVLATS